MTLSGKRPTSIQPASSESGSQSPSRLSGRLGDWSRIIASTPSQQTVPTRGMITTSSIAGVVMTASLARAVPSNLRYHLLVAYLVDYKGISVHELLNRDFDQAQLEAEILASE